MTPYVTRPHPERLQSEQLQGGHVAQCWFVVQSRPKKERVVEGLLAQASIETFVPRLQRGSGTLQPLFPGYCFVKADLTDATMCHMIRYTRGVARILSDAAGPLAVAPAVLETLFATTRHGVVEQELLYSPGDTVRVTRGMLADLIGIVEKNLPEQRRVRILFKWLARKVQADVDYRLLERAA